MDAELHGPIYNAPGKQEAIRKQYISVSQYRWTLYFLFQTCVLIYNYTIIPKAQTKI